ncbi:polysaccharide deacetylase family protein [Jannaschia aquimarina]|uniref:Chitooligosaccharide deacetylase n=1 Tax=Jannaschia aquimarina TaxID=935700 RepID=A0A0D1ELA8_9RHOB|nr:polysaccharide deacetylase family protein [Jannaschia aquimarina]KIT16560.1 Peptidoglycan-N-acetylglucosamine deacetylase [Jannaschia aquimarina]SNT41825.1 Peptidoglycan/xylan/chitin deacetylase, PgdA/CDA1 family [Jannaschia aquimarina]
MLSHLARALAACLALLSTALPTAACEIAITLDDLPYVMPSRTSPSEGLAQVRAVNEALAAHGVEATGFAVGGQIGWRSRRAVAAFAEAGHTVGNHSWSHPDYGTLTPEQFCDETQRTDEALSRWIGESRLYRFPFLREGETAVAKAAADEVLAELGYVNVPVTIDTDDWRYNADYIDALDRGDEATTAEIAEAYLAHMRERTLHFEALAEEAIGREVPHILLLHMNRINADHLGALLDWYAAEGWTFVTVEEAMRDPFYAMPDLYAGPRGLSQIERVMGRPSE